MNCMANVDNPENDNYLALCCFYQVGQDIEGGKDYSTGQRFHRAGTCGCQNCLLSSIKYLGHLAIIPELRCFVMIGVQVKFHVPSFRLAHSLSICQPLGVLWPSWEVTTLLSLGWSITGRSQNGSQGLRSVSGQMWCHVCPGPPKYLAVLEITSLSPPVSRLWC